MDTAAGITTIEAKPDASTIDVSKTAAIVVDMQNDFGAKGSMFDHAGCGSTPAWGQPDRHGWAHQCRAASRWAFGLWHIVAPDADDGLVRLLWLLMGKAEIGGADGALVPGKAGVVVQRRHLFVGDQHPLTSVR